MADGKQPAFGGKGVVDAEAAGGGGGEGEVVHECVVAQRGSGEEIGGKSLITGIFEESEATAAAAGSHQLQAEQVAVGAVAEFGGFDAGFVFG